MTLIFPKQSCPDIRLNPVLRIGSRTAEALKLRLQCLEFQVEPCTACRGMCFTSKAAPPLLAPCVPGVCSSHLTPEYEWCSTSRSRSEISEERLNTYRYTGSTPPQLEPMLVLVQDDTSHPPTGDGLLWGSLCTSATAYWCSRHRQFVSIIWVTKQVC